YHKLPRGSPGSSTHARASSAAPRALWLDPQIIASSDYWRYEPEKVFLGRCGEQFIGLGDDRHLVTIAASRSGKGRSAIIPNLLLYPGSTLVLDPKGENAGLTAEQRAEMLGHDVYVIDPYGVADVPDRLKAGFNPFDLLSVHDPYFVDDCATLAEGLVMSDPKEANNHWNTTAKLILRGIISYVMSNEDVETKTLSMVSNLLAQKGLSRDEDGFKGILRLILEEPEIGFGIPAEMAALLLSTGDNEYGSLLATVRKNLAFASSPPMAKCLSGGEDGKLRRPSLKTWKHEPTTIYLCLPAHLLHTHSRFFRVFLYQLMAAVERHPAKPEIPALMVLDEMHVLGHMPILETAAGLFAGYGVKIWSFWQDLSQLIALYDKRWVSFIGNAGLIQAFGPNDMQTMEFLSNRLGGSSILSINQSDLTISQAASGASGQSKSIQKAPLLSADEIAYFFSRQSGNQLLIYPGSDPIFIERQNHDEPAFQQLLQSQARTTQEQADEVYA
ncbi:MAG: type IV secretory system conjugative DNA transfer family protein, partial [Pseudomonadota bacterium]